MGTVEMSNIILAGITCYSRGNSEATQRTGARRASKRSASTATGGSHPVYRTRETTRIEQHLFRYEYSFICSTVTIGSRSASHLSKLTPARIRIVQCVAPACFLHKKTQRLSPLASRVGKRDGGATATHTGTMSTCNVAASVQSEMRAPLSTLHADLCRAAHGCQEA